jgi:uncharacterized membrane protein
MAIRCWPSADSAKGELAYASDPAPHWGCNFVYWKQYQLLAQCL